MGAGGEPPGRTDWYSPLQAGAAVHGWWVFLGDITQLWPFITPTKSLPSSTWIRVWLSGNWSHVDHRWLLHRMELVGFWEACYVLYGRFSFWPHTRDQNRVVTATALAECSPDAGHLLNTSNPNHAPSGT